MSETEPMTIDERRKYIHKMWGRYRDANRKEKGRMLDEMESVTGMNRKSINRLIIDKLSRKKRERQRGKVYGIDVDDAVRVIARSLDYPCGERLHCNLQWMATHLTAHHELVIQPETMKKLGQMSVSTLKRILKRVGGNNDKLAFHPPKRPQNNTLRKQYPMSRIAWDEKAIGHLEVDMVHHGGSSAMGEYVHTLQMIDVASGWCEIIPVFGRSARVVRNGFQALFNQIPFPVMEIHPDNGSEFFNRTMLTYWQEKYPEARISRSRPYEKNDNRFVEENNHSLIRAYLGNDRYDTLAHLAVLRKIYPILQNYHNLFLPVRRLVEKQVITSTRIRKIYDQAKTPYERLRDLGGLGKGKEAEIEEVRRTINPVALRTDLEKLLGELWDLPVLDNTETVDIFETLIKEADSSVTLSFEPSIDFR